jgi:hypothetical protein
MITLLDKGRSFSVPVAVGQIAAASEMAVQQRRNLFISSSIFVTVA